MVTPPFQEANKQMMWAWLFIGLQLGYGATSEAANPNNTNIVEQADMGSVPIDFRCDNLLIHTNPNRHLCRNNVVIRRGNLLVCCKEFTGTADAGWVWQSFVCKGDVRAQRGHDTVWASKAEFSQLKNHLTLTGSPVLQSSDSLLTGEKIIIDTKDEHAVILNPSGRVASNIHAPQGQEPQHSLDGPLPKTCPIGPLAH